MAMHLGIALGDSHITGISSCWRSKSPFMAKILRYFSIHGLWPNPQSQGNANADHPGDVLAKSTSTREIAIKKYFGHTIGISMDICR
ncbi:hypothetical protein FRX31_017915, partial [Thalictrum thalictroides]